jgi:hypothetical protein
MQTEEISWKQLTVLYLHDITHLHFAPLPLNFNPVASCTTSAFGGNLGKGCCGCHQQVNEEAVQTTSGMSLPLHLLVMAWAVCMQLHPFGNAKEGASRQYKQRAAAPAALKLRVQEKNGENQVLL